MKKDLIVIAHNIRSAYDIGALFRASDGKEMEQTSIMNRKLNIKYLVIGCLVMWAFFSWTAVSFAAADPNASVETQRVLDYFVSLPALESNKVLSGQMVGFLTTPDTSTFSNIYQLSGKYPAVMSGNYRNFGGDEFDFSQTNPMLIAHWNSGGFVEIACPFLNPVTNVWDKDTPVDIQRVITNGTNENTNFKAELDRVAIGLSELQDNGVVVLYRPLHEMNCSPPNCHWWSGQSYDNYKNLWNYQFNYFTQTKGLHNLLWVFAALPGLNNELNYYPGNNYVDIVGIDYYSNTGNGDFPLVPAYTNLLTLGKPFALTELGQCTDPKVISCAGKDARKIIQSIRQSMPDIIYWSTWRNYLSLDNQLYVDELLADSWVVNRGEISTFIKYAIPTNLSANAISSTQVDVSWSAPVNDATVVGYKVYRTGVLVATLGLQLNYSDTGLSPGTTYNYKVSTYDASGNESNKTTLVQATTQTTDTTPPAAPSGLSVI